MNTMSLTPRSQQTLSNAANFSKECGHSYVGTEHLLVGLLRLKEGVAFKLLDEAGVKEETVQAWLVANGQVVPLTEAQQLQLRVKNLETAVLNLTAQIKSESTEGAQS